MKPIPIEETNKEIPGIPLNSSRAFYSRTNRRATSGSVQTIYPWLLFASTAVAATFCLAYVTKPVILAGPSPASASPAPKQVASAGTAKPAMATEKSEILPDPSRLPGDEGRPSAEKAEGKTPAASQTSNFEETNIRVQHVLDAESENGEVDRIIVDVPVLYRSRNLRWTQQEAAEARKLLEQLTAHQEKTRALRDEGSALLDSWNSLMAASIPSDSLRADSPSLPANQFDPLAQDGATAEDTIETIRLNKPEE